MCLGKVLFWSCLFGVLNASCIWMLMSLQDLGNFLLLLSWIAFLFFVFELAVLHLLSAGTVSNIHARIE
jgi:hypothetical protein